MRRRFELLSLQSNGEDPNNATWPLFDTYLMEGSRFCVPGLATHFSINITAEHNYASSVGNSNRSKSVLSGKHHLIIQIHTYDLPIF